MTPMIDVVFLLIIFFLVSSHLAKQESQVELKLPVAASGTDDVPKDVPRITVNVKSDGELSVRGAVVQREELLSLFQSARQSEPGETIEVRIRGSRGAPYSSVEPIMLACSKAGIWDISYAVYRDQP